MDEERVAVRVENTYECGRESEAVRYCRPPRPGESLGDWVEDAVQDLGGDGHPCGSRENAIYEFTVLEAPNPTLVGFKAEAGG